MSRLLNIAKRMVEGDEFYLSKSPRISRIEIAVLNSVGLVCQEAKEHFGITYVYPLDKDEFVAKLTEIEANLK